jgi:hypothetical protein
MILQILQITVLDITTHKIGNPVSLLTADLNEDDSSISSTTNVLQPKINSKYPIDHTRKKKQLYFYLSFKTSGTD